MSVLVTPTRTEPVFDLASHGARPALVTAQGAVSYADLDARVRDFAHDVLGPQRRLVLIESANRVETVVAHLAALQHGHAVMLVPDADRAVDLMTAYDPDVVVRRASGVGGGAGATDGAVEVRREGSAHDLHPDLAMAMSTSGSTGSPKLVRLSHANLRSNAASIATYLRLRPQDRAATSLPMHYCYGLSVLHSHLMAGASLLLTENSVVDPCFWDAFDAEQATSLAGVPYTFDLLDRSGFAERRHPSLRYLTQAGGRMAPETVRRYAERGLREGWELVVMYGATEATARMAYLPAHLATRRPEAIGMPIPGGALRIDPDTSELVYSGPNVMLGYAETAADLALGRTVTELRTGDLARVRDGLFEVTGRTGRHAKIFGLRIDLDRVEQAATTHGTPVWCVADDDRIHAFTTRPRAGATVAERVLAATGLPRHAVSSRVLAELPFTASGKPDRQALVALARSPESARESLTVRQEFALVLGRPDATDADTFVSLGGDSLSYVELATRLSRRVDPLPQAWHRTSIGDLDALGRPQPRGSVRLDTTVLLRAIAIVAIVGSHADLFTLMGGAHVLLAVAGYNLARFALGEADRVSRCRQIMVGVAQVAVPSAAFIAAVALVSGDYDWPTAAFLNGALGSDSWTADWQFWFLEALIWCSLGLAGVNAIPAFDRLERNRPFSTAYAVLLAALVVRFTWVGLEAGPTERYTIGVVAWCVALGWVFARAETVPQRLLTIAAAAIGFLGFFGDPTREALILGGVALLGAAPSIRVPRLAAAPLGVLAGSSLFVYLTHWQVYPHLEPTSPLLALVASLAVGIVSWLLARPLMVRLGRALRRQPGARARGITAGSATASR
jgi:acyl-CoA synthetase (AMP-forming)/AMP-acid ligase II